MNDLIYFSTRVVRYNDVDVIDPTYKFSPWFRLMDTLEWPSYTSSRVHNISTPWSLAPTLSKIPDIPNNAEEDFTNVIESIANKFCQYVIASNRQPHICWSGGLDSTSILVSLLKVAPAEVLKNLVVLCNQDSIHENPYFYYRYIDQKLCTKDIGSFRIDESNYDKIVIADGEAGNQNMGWRSMHIHSYLQNFDFLDQDWRSVADPKTILFDSSDLVVELMTESIKHAPIPINTVHDFIWWGNFNFKFNETLIRKVISYTKFLTPSQSKDFYKSSLFRFYEQPEMQIWSMLTTDLRRKMLRVTSKWVPKDYIYQFDKNDFWFACKKEASSVSPLDVNSDTATVVAVDSNWNKYKITEPSTRKTLGQILQRI